MTELNEHSLALFRAGDAAVFKQLYDIHSHRIYMMALNILKNPPDAEDVTVTVMLKLWQRKDQIRSIEHLKASLYTMAKTTSIDIMRNRRYKDETIGEAVTQIPLEQEIELFEIRESALKILYEAFKKLPPKQRKIIHLYYTDELSAGEIAQRLNVSVHTVYNHLASAKKKLRKTVHTYKTHLRYEPQRGKPDKNFK